MSNGLGKTAYLKRRGGKWYYRRRYPSDLISIIGTEMFVRSTGEADEAKAKKLLGTMEARYRMAIAEAEDRQSQSAISQTSISGIRPSVPTLQFPSASSLPRLDDAQAAQIAANFFHERLIDLDRQPAGIDHDPEELVEIEHWIATLADHCNPHTLRWTQDLAAKLLTRHGLAAEAHRGAGLLLTTLLARALSQLLSVQAARLQGDYSDQVSDAAFTLQPVATVAMPEAPSSTLTDLIAVYVADEQDPDNLLSTKTIMKRQAIFAVLRRYFGADRRMASISRADCRAFRDLLAELPPNFTKRQNASKLSLDQIAAQNVAASGAKLARATQANYLEALARILTFAKAEGYIVTNPLEKTLSARGARIRRQDARHAYSESQLRKIFSAPVFTGAVDDEAHFSVPQVGNVIRRSRFWLPIVALFTGLRMNEILQLTRWHVQDGGDRLPCLLIGPDMQLKTPASYRVVPVHDMLLKIGFLKLVETGKPDELLFPDVPAGSDGYRSSVFSKRYATFQKSLKLDEEGRKVSFHSFRHNFRDALRLPDIDAALAREIGGWSRSSDTFDSYGSGARAVILRPLINRVSYEVDFDHLFPA